MNSGKHIEIIQDLTVQAIDALGEDHAGNPLNDLFLQVDQQNGEVSVFDENEKLFGKEVVFDWVLPDLDEDDFFAKIMPELKKIMFSLNEKSVFDKIFIEKPFSVSLVNDGFDVVEELLFLDDDTLKLDDELWKDMDKELDAFLRDLLSDTK